MKNRLQYPAILLSAIVMIILVAAVNPFQQKKSKDKTPAADTLTTNIAGKRTRSYGVIYKRNFAQPPSHGCLGGRY